MKRIGFPDDDLPPWLTRSMLDALKQAERFADIARDAERFTATLGEAERIRSLSNSILRDQFVLASSIGSLTAFGIQQREMFERVNKWLGPASAPNDQMMRTMAEVARNYSQVNAASAAFQDLVGTIENLGIRFKWATYPALISPSIAAILGEQARMFRMADPAGILELLETIDEVEPDSDESSITTSLRDIRDFLANLITNHKDNIAFILTIVGLILNVYQIVDARIQKIENDRRWAVQREADANRDQLLTAMNEQLKEMRRSEEQKRAEFVVRRATTLRSKNNSRSRTICQLYPNNTVVVLERGKDWSYIEFFDVIDGEAKRGWVLKKYIEPLRRN